MGDDGDDSRCWSLTFIGSSCNLCVRPQPLHACARRKKFGGSSLRMACWLHVCLQGGVWGMYVRQCLGDRMWHLVEVALHFHVRSVCLGRACAVAVFLLKLRRARNHVGCLFAAGLQCRPQRSCAADGPACASDGGGALVKQGGSAPEVGISAMWSCNLFLILTCFYAARGDGR